MADRSSPRWSPLDPLRRGYRRRFLRLVKPRDFKESYIGQALATYSNPTYLEIGVREGESFRVATATRKIGIDPVALPAMKQLRSGEEFYELTSDEFFSERASQVLQPASIHVALIDGLHEFRQVARDLFSLEPYMRPDGIVFFDDINPSSRDMASEAPPGVIDVRPGELWNGDVWKIGALIARACPDLTLRTVDADYGVGVLSGFGAAISRDVQAEIDECKALDYGELESSRRSLLNLVAPREFDAILSATRRVLDCADAPRIE
jgi:hypothetical protein